ncbi:MAG: PAS domain-containing protein [Rhodoferax sp.]|nr:PAS domain-containing protein [Rhodoferax sp.]
MHDTVPSPYADERRESLETRYERLRYAYGTLLESYEELTEQLREMRDIHIVTDPTGVILQCSSAASLISPAQHLLGTQLSDWIVASERDQFLDLLADAALRSRKTRTPCRTRVQRDTPDAQQIDMLLQALPVADEGEVGVIHWVLRPVKQEVEEAFQLQRPIVEFEHITECGLRTDAQGVIRAVNAAFTRTTGYTAEDAIGKTPRLLNSGLQDPDFYKDLWTDLLSVGHWQGLLFNRKKSGEIYFEWLTIRAENAADGSLTGYIGVFYDVGMVISKKQQLLARSLPFNVYRTQPLESGVGPTDQP